MIIFKFKKIWIFWNIVWIKFKRKKYTYIKKKMIWINQNGMIVIANCLKCSRKRRSWEWKSGNPSELWSMSQSRKMSKTCWDNGATSMKTFWHDWVVDHKQWRLFTEFLLSFHRLPNSHYSYSLLRRCSWGSSRVKCNLWSMA